MTLHRIRTKTAFQKLLNKTIPTHLEVLFQKSLSTLIEVLVTAINCKYILKLCSFIPTQCWNGTLGLLQCKRLCMIIKMGPLIKDTPKEDKPLNKGQSKSTFCV